MRLSKAAARGARYPPMLRPISTIFSGLACAARYASSTADVEGSTPPARVKHAGLEPLPAFLSRLSVRRQKEPLPSRPGDGPYCYLKNPGFEPCCFWLQ